MKCRVSLLLALVCFSLSNAQQDPLTNDSILKMVRAGLSEDVIVSMVKSQPAQYAVAPDQLIALKAAGVPDKVVAAMIDKSAGGGPGGLTVPGLPGNRPTGATPAGGTVASGNPNDPMTPHDSGIYLYAKDRNGEYKLTVLERAAYQGTKMGIGPCSITGGLIPCKMKAVIPGPSASIRTEPDPVFYFYFDDKAAGLGKSYFGASSVSNPNQFALLKLESKKSNRETVISKVGAGGVASGSDASHMVPFKSDRLRAGLYKVTMSAPLAPGQYCFLSSVIAGAYGAGAAGAGDLFDFAVSPNQ